MFLQDNAPVHKSKFTMEFFQKNGVDVIDFPPNSPDLNPIKKVWNDLKDLLEEKNPKSNEELRKAIKKSWREISLRKIGAQIGHLPQILKKVIEKKGEFVD